MTPEELLKLDWMGRFKQSIQTIRDNKVFWVLKNPNGSYSIPEGRPKKFCVWGEESHAQYNCTDGWEDTIPTAMSFEDFMSGLYPRLKKGKVNTILVSPMRNRRGKEIPITEFFERVGIETDTISNNDVLSDHIVILTPIDDKILKGLFDYLDEKLGTEGCKNDLTLTVAYLKNHGVKDLDNAIAWLQSKGGYCDCEVLANVEE